MTAAVHEVSPPPAGAAPKRRRHHPFATFVVRRVAAGVVTLLAVSLLLFLATNALPGNVAQVVLGRDATPARVAALERSLDLNRPLLDRYGSWLGNAVQGDLGQSSVQLAQGAQSAPIGGVIATALRNSIVLAGLATLLLAPLTLLAGTLAAKHERGVLDYGITYGSLVLGSLPEFVLGTFLVVIFFTQLGLLPPVALVPPGTGPLTHPDALILPVLTLLIVSLAFSARQVRAGMIHALRQDYVLMARLGGLPERRVLWRYALRNALAPSVQAFAQTVQYLFGGIIVVEALFAYPGIGDLLVNAVQTRDITEVQSIALILAAAYIAINIIADLVVVLLIPKLRTAAP